MLQITLSCLRMRRESLVKQAPSSRSPARSQGPGLRPCSAPTISKPPTESLDRPTCLGIALLQHLYGRVSRKTITKQQRSQAFPVPSLQHLLRNLRFKMPRLKGRNRRSPRLLTRDGRERAMNTRCAGGIYGCPEAS